MKRSTVIWLLALGIGGCAVCGIVCCLGIVGGLGFGMSALAEEVRLELEQDPQLTEHVGQITSFKLNMSASAATGEDVYAYDVVGTKWSGRMLVKHETDDEGREVIEWARFTLPSGEKVELRPKPPDVPATDP